MNNLLLFEDRQAILGVYRRRRLVVFMTFVIAILVIAIILLLVVYGTLLIKQETRQQLVNAQAETKAEQESRTYRGETLLTQRSIRQVNTMSPRNPSTFIDAVLAQKPAGVHIAAITFSHIESSRYALVLEGRADTRKQFVGFVDSLKSDARFASVESPLTNVIRDVDSHFAITLTIAGSQAKQN